MRNIVLQLQAFIIQGPIILRQVLRPLPDSVKRLIEAKCYAHVATLMPDGSPHVTQTWVDHDGDIVLINTPKGTQKHKNVLRDPRIALDIINPDNPFNQVVIRGRVREVTFDGAEEHIDKMAKKYQGKDKYERRQPGERRVLIKIEPLHIVAPRETLAVNRNVDRGNTSPYGGGPQGSSSPRNRVHLL